MKGFLAHNIGRRKTSVARVFLKNGEGKILVNGKDLKEYFTREILQFVVKQPLIALESEEKYDIVITVKGGGKSGQAGACRLGVARALDAVDETARGAIKPLGFLTRDSREVERKKYGKKKKKKSTQFSKR